MKKYKLSIVTTFDDEAPDDKTIIRRAIYECEANDLILYITICNEDGEIIAEVDANSEVPNV